MANADFPEVVWSIFALIGFMVNAWALKEALADQAWLAMSAVNENDEAVYTVMARLAQENVRQETMRTVKQLIFLVGGVVRMSIPAATPAYDSPFPPSAVAIIAIVVVSFIMCMNAVFEMQARREAMRLMRLDESNRARERRNR